MIVCNPHCFLLFDYIKYFHGVKVQVPVRVKTPSIASETKGISQGESLYFYYLDTTLDVFHRAHVRSYEIKESSVNPR